MSYEEALKIIRKMLDENEFSKDEAKAIKIAIDLLENWIESHK